MENIDIFPEFDTFQDYRGRQVKFRYDLFDAGNVYSLRAWEVTDSQYPRRFAAFDPVSPANALYRIRGMIREELNVRYFATTKGTPFDDMNFSYFRGNITTDEETGGPCFVVDGKKMNMEQFERIISPYREWRIEVKILEE